MKKTNFEFPDDIIFFRNLLLQRTNVLFDAIGAEAFSAWAERGDAQILDAAYFDPDIRKRVFSAVQLDFYNDALNILTLMQCMRPSSLVSIGPGNLEITLIDIEQTDAHHHGYARSGSGYASLYASKKFMTDNGVAPEKIAVCNPTRDALPSEKFDLLISILSMGFHYPCDDYIHWIIANCSPGGALIIDARRNVPDGGLRMLLNSGFELRGSLSFPKFDRILLCRI